MQPCQRAKTPGKHLCGGPAFCLTYHRAAAESRNRQCAGFVVPRDHLHPFTL
jgi:hypothetical protein